MLVHSHLASLLPSFASLVLNVDCRAQVTHAWFEYLCASSAAALLLLIFVSFLKVVLLVSGNVIHEC